MREEGKNPSEEKTGTRNFATYIQKGFAMNHELLPTKKKRNLDDFKDSSYTLNIQRFF